jgi:hypothetical protein
MGRASSTHRVMIKMRKKVQKPKGKKRSRHRPRRRYTDDIKINITEVGLEQCGLDSALSG